MIVHRVEWVWKDRPIWVVPQERISNGFCPYISGARAVFLLPIDRKLTDQPVRVRLSFIYGHVCVSRHADLRKEVLYAAFM